MVLIGLLWLETLDMSYDCLVASQTVAALLELCICRLCCPAMCDKDIALQELEAFCCRWPAFVEVCGISLAFSKNVKWAGEGVPDSMWGKFYMELWLWKPFTYLYLFCRDFRELQQRSVCVRIRNKTVKSWYIQSPSGFLLLSVVLTNTD